MADTYTLLYSLGGLPPDTDPALVEQWRVGTWESAELARERLVCILLARAASSPGEVPSGSLGALIADVRSGAMRRVELGMYAYTVVADGYAELGGWQGSAGQAEVVAA